jgi:alkylation response protein AidB-like acyl-CoA dehydrogenase
MNFFNFEKAKSIYNPVLFKENDLDGKINEYLEMASWLRESFIHFDEDLDYILKNRNVPVVELLTSDNSSNCKQRTLIFEILSYGDMNSFFACPNVSLSGILVRALGNNKQQSTFFNYVKENRCRTFFGITEPNKGSDAANIETAYINGRLNGKKWLVGAASDAEIGTVLCRKGNGPLDRCTLLITKELLESPRVKRYRLKERGTSGALLSYIEFNDLEVPECLILGKELRPLESGTLAIIRTFHQMRTCVAAMAIGQAQAVLHYFEDLEEYTNFKSNVEELQEKLNHARALNYHAAKIIDQAPLSRKEVALAKMTASRLSEEIIERVIYYSGTGSLIKYPYLRRILQHSYGFEFMEGTSAMQKNHLIAEYIS